MVTKNSTAFERIGGHSLMPRVVQKKKVEEKYLKKRKARSGDKRKRIWVKTLRASGTRAYCPGKSHSYLKISQNCI